LGIRGDGRNDPIKVIVFASLSAAVIFAAVNISIEFVGIRLNNKY